jgi:hypothetical protein
MILRNDVTGRSTIWHSVDLVEYGRTRGMITAASAAEVIFDTAKPSEAEREGATQTQSACNKRRPVHA